MWTFVFFSYHLAFLHLNFMVGDLHRSGMGFISMEEPCFTCVSHVMTWVSCVSEGLLEWEGSFKLSNLTRLAGQLSSQPVAAPG